MPVLIRSEADNSTPISLGQIKNVGVQLLQLFVYRCLKRGRRPTDPCDTIRHIVEVMLRDLGAISEPIPWSELADTS